MSDDGSKYIQILQQEPNEKVLLEVLDHFLDSNIDHIVESKLITALLDYTIPQIYTISSLVIKNRIINILQSIRGISGVINKVNYGLSVDGSNNDTMAVFGQILNDLFSHSLLANINSEKTIEINEINKLLFKGQCFSVFTEMITKGVVVESKVFESLSSYISFLMSILIESKHVNNESFIKYFISLLTLDPSYQMVIFEIIFNPTNLDIFTGHLNSVKMFQRKNVCEFILNCISKRGFDFSKTPSISQILFPCFSSEVFDSFFIEKVLKQQNDTTISLISSLINQYNVMESVFNSTLKKWGDSNFIKSEPLGIQVFRTKFLIQLAYFGGESFITKIMSSPHFIDAITGRLNSYSNSVKTLAVVLADKFCERSSKEKIFSIEDLGDYEYLLDESQYITNEEKYSIEECWSKLEMPIITFPHENDDIPTKGIDKLTISKTYMDSDDESSESDEEDDPSIAQRIKLPSPMYIKELIKYLAIDTSHQQAYDMRRIALTTGPTLIRQKAQFGSELSSNSEELLHILLGLDNQFNDEDFEELKLNCLISILVACPSSAIEIIKMLNTGDYSLQQRIIVLTSLSLAARDIRGFKDEKVTRSYKEKDFATKTLPSQLHNKYMSLQEQKTIDRVQQVHLSIQDSLMAPQSENAKDEIAGGRILRISRRLRKPESTDLVKPRFKDYSDVIRKNFFFPLTYTWHEVGTIDIGHYSPILIGHYIKTMALLLHTSYASVTNYDMVREFILIVNELIKITKPDELQTIEGIVTGLLLICDITDEQELVIRFGQYLANCQEFISSIWEVIIDEKVKSLCAGFLIRCTNIFEKYQGNLIDQLNNVY